MISFCYDTSLQRWQKTDVIQKKKKVSLFNYFLLAKLKIWWVFLLTKFKNRVRRFFLSIFSIFSSYFFYRPAGLFMNRPSWLVNVGEVPTCLDFKPRLSWIWVGVFQGWPSNSDLITMSNSSQWLEYFLLC